jgi:hypothetical protein
MLPVETAEMSVVDAQGYSRLPHASKMKLPDQPYNFVERVRASHSQPYLLLPQSLNCRHAHLGYHAALFLASAAGNLGGPGH